MRIATWNVNSVRARLTHVTEWLTRVRPDVLCLQETKCVDAEFPQEAIEACGYRAAIWGEKGYNGVALLARAPIEDVALGIGEATQTPQTRVIAGTIGGIRVMSVYVPNGTAMKHERCQYKLAWLRQLRAHLDATYTPDTKLVLAGDLNVATRDVDIADPAKWHKTVLAHPDIRAALQEVVDFGLVDAFAAHHPEGGLYSWWDYRTDSYAQGRGGLRIDHVLATPAVSGLVTRASIDHAERGRQTPSDHVPVMIELA